MRKGDFSVSSEDTTPLGRMIQEERNRRRLRLRDVAEPIGISLQYLNDLERGKNRSMSNAVMTKLTTMLDIPTDVVWFTAGRLPPDIRTDIASAEAIVCAFDGMRRVLGLMRDEMQPDTHEIAR